MKKIHHLPPHLISQIAAGEVIERPAYAVKELLENALDAQADYITIQIEDGGLKKITITDNGEGMSKEDLQESIKPHTTSKLSEKEGLHSIKTLGFRGEALSSIAAISSLTLRSRTADSPSGTLLEVTAGEIKNITPIGAPLGTQVIIQHLFSQVPARKKFLKSSQTEFRHILEIVQNVALLFPQVRFFLSHNHKPILDLPKNQPLIERIQDVLGSSLTEQLLPVHVEDTYIKIDGFITKPQAASKYQQKQYLFVNKRRISDKLISLAVKEAYGNLIEAAFYPVVMLFLTLPYEAVDVNVHPRKEQVSFVDSRMVFDAVNKAVSQTLEQNNLTFHTLLWKEDTAKKGQTTSYAGKLLKKLVLTPKEEKIDASDILQTHMVYLVSQTKQGIIILDQHAAHERIMYEKFLKEFSTQKHKKEIHTLSDPEVFEATSRETSLIEEYQEELMKLGFQIELFRDRTYILHTVPLLFKDRKATILLHELFEELVEKNGIVSLDVQSTRMLAYLACRSAIKAGDKLTKKQMKNLIEELEKTPNNATCPHGRPTRIEITLGELHRKFKRT